MRKIIYLCIVLLFAIDISSLFAKDSKQINSRRRETYIVSKDRQSLSKVHCVPGDLRILKIYQSGTRKISTDGGKRWISIASKQSMNTPHFEWESTLFPDSFFACNPIQIHEHSTGLTVVSTTSHNNRFFFLDAQSGEEKWRVNVPSIDSVFTFRDSYYEGEIIKFSGLVLNDKIMIMSGYKCDLEVERSSGKVRGLGYSLDPEYSVKPGPWLMVGDQYYIAGTVSQGTDVRTLERSGRVQHSSLVRFGPFESAWGRSIVSLRDGNMLVTGTGYGADLQLSSWLLKTTLDGDSIWSYYGTVSDEDSISPLVSQSIELEDGSIISLASSYTRRKGIPAYIHLLKFSPEGEHLWTRAYPSSSNTEGYAFVRLPNNMFVIAGVTGFTPGDEFGVAEDFYLLLLNPEGEVVDEYRWGAEGKADQLSTVSVASNGDLFVGGLTDGGTNWEGAKNYFARIKLSALSVPEPSANRSLFDIYPNPTLSTSEISFNIHALVVSSELIDVKGEVVRQLHQTLHVSSGDHVSIDVSDVPSGYYFVRINTPNGSFIKPLVRQ